MSLPSADDFYSIFLATLPVSTLPADRKTTLTQWRPLQAQLIVLKELRVLKKTEETMMFYLFSPTKKKKKKNNSFKVFLFKGAAVYL